MALEDAQAEIESHRDTSDRQQDRDERLHPSNDSRNIISGVGLDRRQNGGDIGICNNFEKLNSYRHKKHSLYIMN